MTDAERTDRIDRLLDAVELLKADRRDEARDLLRDLIREDNNFEDAWLWMSVAVKSLDQSSICLDNVLRVNPRNVAAAGALFRIRAPELRFERRRNRLRAVRDFAQLVLWFLIMVVLFASYLTIFGVTISVS